MAPFLHNRIKLYPNEKTPHLSKEKIVPVLNFCKFYEIYQLQLACWRKAPVMKVIFY